MIETVYKVIFSPWLSQEKIDLANASTREQAIFCRYLDNKNGKTRSGMLNEKTREILWADGRPLVGLKMFGVAAAVTPISTIYYTGLLVARIPYVIAKLFHMHIINFVNEIASCKFTKAFCDELLLGLVVGLVKEVVTRPFKLLRVLYYTIGMEMAAVLSFMLTPDIGKRLYALLEEKRNGSNKREGIPKELSEATKYFFENEVLWFAPCPHPWGSLDDTYTTKDGSEKARYKILSKSAELTDVADGNNCTDAPPYLIYPCIPLYRG